MITIKENLINNKELLLPEGWEIEKIIDNRIILRKSDGIDHLKTWEECYKELGVGEFLLSDSCITKKARLDNPKDTTRTALPEGFGRTVLALCQLLVCRNAWWKRLGWKPDWDTPDEKHCIVRKGEAADKQIKSFESCILAFPTYEVRDQFLNSFRDLIEEAKELI